MRTHVPDFWSDQKKAEAQMRKIKTLKMWIEKCAEVEAAVGEVEVGFDFVKEGNPVDVCYAIVENYFAGNTFTQLRIRDMRKGEDII